MQEPQLQWRARDRSTSSETCCFSFPRLRLSATPLPSPKGWDNLAPTSRTAGLTAKYPASKDCKKNALRLTRKVYSPVTFRASLRRQCAHEAHGALAEVLVLICRFLHSSGDGLQTPVYCVKIQQKQRDENSTSQRGG